jgi:tetratricopeptide (TPR) repeat protein
VTPVPAATPRASPTDEASPPEKPKAEVESPPSKELTEEVLYQILVAEIAGQRGKLDIALDNYLDLARKIPDPQLAQRATGIAIYAKKDDEALEATRLWVKAEPGNPEAQQALAALLIQTGNVDEAFKHIESLLDSGKGNTGHTLQLIANLLSREEDKTRALGLMEKLAKGHDQNPEVLFAYSLLALRSGEAAKAKQAMEKVMALAPSNKEFAMAYLGVLQQTGDKRTALSWLEDWVGRHPEDFDMRMAYARLLADSSAYHKALEQFSVLEKTAPANPDVRFALGLLHLQENDRAKAKGYLTTLVNDDQYTDEASFQLGQIAEADKDYASALKWYSSINKSTVSKGDIYFDAQLSIAMTLAKQGKIAEASEQLHKIESKSPEQRVRLIKTEAEILAQEEKYEEALAIYDRALNEHRDNADLLYSRAMLAERMKRIDLMERDLRRLLELEPDNAQALNALGYTLADRTGRYQEAHALIKRALELKPNDYYILDSMGWVLYRLGRLPEAADHLRRAKAIRNDPEIAAHLGEVLWAMGDQKGAREIWKKALKTAPGDEKILEVMERLAR